jgi:hypothetical protein
MKNVYSFVKTKGAKDGEPEGAGMKASVTAAKEEERAARPLQS